MTNIFSKHVIPLKELLTKEFPPLNWVVEYLIPTNGITVISGQPSCFKTWLFLYMAKKIAIGDIVFGQFRTAQSKILIIDEENGERLLHDRFVKLQTSPELPISVTSILGIKIENVCQTLIEYCLENDYKVVIFDSLVRIHNADENDAKKMAEVFAYLKKMTKHGITVIVTHHHRKQNMHNKSSNSQNMRGSSDILASIDCHLAVTKVEDSLEIEQTKLRQQQELNSFKLLIKNNEDFLDFEFAGYNEIKTSKKIDSKNAIVEILQKNTEKMNKTQLYGKIKEYGYDIGEKTFNTAYKELISEKIIIETRGEKNCLYPELDYTHPRFTEEYPAPEHK